MRTFFRHNATIHLIDDSINIIFLCTGKPKNLWDSFHCDICFTAVVWNLHKVSKARLYSHLQQYSAMNIKCLPPGNSQLRDVFHLLTGLSEVTVIINSYTVSSKSSDPFSFHLTTQTGFPGGASGNEPTRQCRRHKRASSSISGLGRFPGGGNSNPLQYSCLENPMDRGAWRATVQRVTKSQTRLKQLSMHTSNHGHTQTHRPS